MIVAGLAVTACASSSARAGSAPLVTLKIGYFPNITHGPALVGVAGGIFARDLAPDHLDASQTFNAGPAETQALLSGAIDLAFIGPSPSITAFTQSHGAVTVISGAASGGASLVVKPSITSASQLRGATLATPQLGNTQDVALRYWLKGQGYATDLQGGGDVHITPQSNSQTVTTFKTGAIAGAWVPEPYVSELVAAGGHVLVDEKTLWPNQMFVTTDVFVRTDFLKAHPATVKRFLEGLVDTIDVIKANPAQAKAEASQQLTSLAAPLLPAVLSSAWSDLVFTEDPLVASFQAEAAHAEAVGLLTAPHLAGIFDLGPLNSVLKAKGHAQVATQ
ncbi:MAG: ABC transporter substrate-binding protein [Acidimicrobiales bacterium]